MRELQAAESQGLKALIIGHAPPTTSFPAQSHYLDQIIQRYRSTVIAQLFGHTHVSDFLVSYSTPAIKTPETASAVGFASGALTPFGGVINPGFRVYELDEVTGEIWDYKDYYANITDPSFKHGPEWRVLYSAREEYGPLIPDSQDKPLDPAFWHSVSIVIENSAHQFRKYIYNKYRGSKWGAELACRTPQCHNRVICNLRRSRSEDRCLAGVDTKQVGTHSQEEVLDSDESSPAAEANAQKFGMQQLLQGIMDKAKKGELQSVDVKGITRRRVTRR
jgi:sphingomyelin phosphodiesterase